ncbi:nuclear transport factor 2 family protein [Allonocardiopsis opalescens]|uniref:Ketosteroid isomerase-like protein n=1 Tax=Allonocardiopsis opalescens TaxID=1144618 RepID=A0A2T0PZY9_9ACTN|nr:nuclear transport factor 2 family protein [Allonocardiopsis opalescens]PRX97086.1 ketosteroid isomerase-like protein [Allonocardiopsis opalescens]
MTTVVSSNIDVVRRMYAAFHARDLDQLRNDVFANDIVWYMPGQHPLSGRHDGIDAVMAFNAALAKAGIVVDNIHLGELDDGTVVEKHTGHGHSQGVDYIFPTCTSYRVQDGKIVEVRVHTNDPHAVNEYMWAQYQLRSLPDRLADGQV